MRFRVSMEVLKVFQRTLGISFNFRGSQGISGGFWGVSEALRIYQRAFKRIQKRSRRSQRGFKRLLVATVNSWSSG